MKKSTGKMSSKGQLIIPAELRREYELQSGAPVRFERRKEGILVRPLTESVIDKLHGILEGKNLSDKIESDLDRDIR